MVRKSLFIVALSALVLGGGYLYAQPAGDPPEQAGPADSSGTPAADGAGDSAGTPGPADSPSGDGAGAGDPASPEATPDATPDAPEDTPDITVPMDKEAQISPREMTSKASEFITEMQGVLEHVVELQTAARKQKDVIKLNCVNDKLLQVKTLLKIAEAARTNLVEAIAQGNDAGRYHQYSQITIAHENVTVLRDEASACIGEELIFLGPTEVNVDAPTLPDDPTAEGDEDYIEPPGYASPYS